MDKMDMFGNIADGSRLTPPAQHSELNQPAPQPIQAQAPQQAVAPRPGLAVPTNQQVNNAPPHMGVNDAQGQALDDYAAEELRRRQEAMDYA